MFFNVKKGWNGNNNVNVEVKDKVSKLNNANDLPPIVLVHGIFGFDKGVSLICFFILVFLSSFILSMDIIAFLLWVADLYLK